MQTHTNRLVNEKSPYLLQHAHNPVDWYPWSDAAFEKAQAEDKPVFLSIGYATCHWCHVMEHESFENEAIARLMNEAFVCIKVDREERPDIDHIYMTVCQMMTHSGGWPLTILMTPDKRPVFAATYIPPEARYGRIGMTELVPRISEAWQTRRAELLASANQMTHALAQEAARGNGSALSPNLLQAGYEELMSEYDATLGGFGRAPKFPTPHRLVFLFRSGKADAVAAVEHTLRAMRLGGMYDQVGYGVHRYSVDAQWLVPHFEKMLYDQALLAYAYIEAFEETQQLFYAEVAREILTYVLRDMTAPEGGFYSAEDADSEGEEGLFYLWKTDELKASLCPEEYAVATRIWKMTPDGNYRDEMLGSTTGMNIPHLSRWPNEEERSRLEGARGNLFRRREKREHPLKDTKILADWNGLMIAALAKAARVLGDETLLAAAQKANQFVATQMRRDGDTLWHRWREGETRVEAYLDDYAFMVFAQLELYAATFDPDYLASAILYSEVLETSFADTKNGGYFMTAKEAEALIVRPKELYDGAVPSGNSVQMLNLSTLARLTGRPEFEAKAIETGKAFSGSINRSPSSFSQALIALQFAEGDGVEIVVVGERGSQETRQMLDYIGSVYNPGKTVLLKDPADAEAIEALAPFTKEMTMLEGRTTIYLCRNHACEPPIHSLEELKQRFR